MNRPGRIPEEFVESLDPGDFESPDMCAVVKAVGCAKAVRLIYNLGGVTVYCHRGGAPGAGSGWAQMADAMGRETADGVRRLFPGDRLYVPEFPLWGAFERYVRSRFNGDVKAAAVMCGLSETVVYDIIRGGTRGASKKRRQERSLF